MKLDILKEQEVPLLNRKRVSALVDFEGGATPSILQFKDSIATKLNVKPELVAIRHVYQIYGATKAKVIVHIYQTRKELLHLEKVKKAEKKAIEATKKAAEEKAKADAEAKKVSEEAPKEEAPITEEKPAEAETKKAAEEAPKGEAPTTEEKPAEESA